MKGPERWVQCVATLWRVHSQLASAACDDRAGCRGKASSIVVRRSSGELAMHLLPPCRVSVTIHDSLSLRRKPGWIMVPFK